MIKSTGRTADGDTVLILGLSRRNTERLLDDQPIKVNGLDVLIGGETERAITGELRGLVTKDTLYADLGGSDTR